MVHFKSRIGKNRKLNGWSYIQNELYEKTHVHIMHILRILFNNFIYLD